MESGDVRIIIQDQHNYALEVAKPVNKRGGSTEVEWVREGYYSNLKSCCLSALQAYPRLTDASDILSAIQTAENNITSSIQRFFDEDPLEELARKMAEREEKSRATMKKNGSTRSKRPEEAMK